MLSRSTTIPNQKQKINNHRQRGEKKIKYVLRLIYVGSVDFSLFYVENGISEPNQEAVVEGPSLNMAPLVWAVF
jgi:hypothetical protein